MSERFTGTVEELGRVQVAGLVAWITAIPFEEWPQQTRLADGAIRPAMVTDLEWHGFGEAVRPLVGENAHNVMLTVLMPGHDIPPHIDQQPPYWLHRVHAPLTTNDVSRFIVGEQAQPCRGHWNGELSQAWQRWTLRSPELGHIKSVALVRLDDTPAHGPLGEMFDAVRLPSYTLAPGFAAVCMMGH